MHKINISFIDGYFQALHDLQGDKGNYINRILEGDIDNLANIENAFDHVYNLEIIEKISCERNDLFYIFHEVIYLNLYEGLSSVDCIVERLAEWMKKTRHYIISHLLDYIDFTFEEEITQDAHQKISIALIKSNNGKIIAITIRKQEVAYTIVLLGVDQNSIELKAVFDRIKSHCKDTHGLLEVINDNTMMKNGLSFRVGIDIIEPIIKKAMKVGYFDEKSITVLSQYLNDEEIEKMKKIWTGQ